MVAIVCTYALCTLGWACTRLSDVFDEIEHEDCDD